MRGITFPFSLNADRINLPSENSTKRARARERERERERERCLLDRLRIADTPQRDPKGEQLAPLAVIPSCADYSIVISEERCAPLF